ncbi:uncharacterized protein LOC131051544 [Cryptomeria japonica]|uniref:uncharacterized protein LOC131051544 n=1 Tax=Cryptomeria japonica TaxID=3369 RepID=UPI0025AB5FBC|nr:uncharacterized protein LOC131051544 [Cryptomeria japonica]
MLRLFLGKLKVTRLQEIQGQQVYRCYGQLKSKSVIMASPIEGATPRTPVISIIKENGNENRSSNSKSSKSRRSLLKDLKNQPQSAIVIDYNEEEEENKSKGWRVYLIISADMRKTYVGVTTNFKRRLRQHNGELNGGAKASRAGRPWQCVCLVHGFKDRSEACEFEWKWKHFSRKSSRKSKKLENVSEQTGYFASPLVKHRQAALNRVKENLDCQHLKIQWQEQSPS